MVQTNARAPMGSVFLVVGHVNWHRSRGFGGGLSTVSIGPVEFGDTDSRTVDWKTRSMVRFPLDDSWGILSTVWSRTQNRRAIHPCPAMGRVSMEWWIRMLKEGS